MPADVIETLRCPRCLGALDANAAAIRCPACGASYPRLGSVPILVSNPDAYLDAYRRQIALFEHRAALTVTLIREQMSDAGVLPLAKLRLEQMIAAVQGQVADVRTVLEPLLPGSWPQPSAEQDRDDLPGPLRHIHYLYRDWSWPADPDGENERAFDLVEGVLAGRPVGRMIVLGAGACRLAYDLHRRAGGIETLAVDLDPLLLAAAETVLVGGSVTIREANAEIDELNRVETMWTLIAPNGPIGDDRFRLLLADALDPPVAFGVFDTVVTPWFIDLVPPDLRDFISTVHRLLKPGGRWLCLGPLRYAGDRPLALRFTREEVFDLAGRAGFHVDDWRTESQPYLVSKLSRRGKIEWVLAFAATKRDDGRKGSAPSASAAASVDVERPAWLLFHHLPVPTFPGQPPASAGDPVREAVLSAIDGKRTVADLADIVRSSSGRTDVSAGQVRDAVRRYLSEIHPAARSAR